MFKPNQYQSDLIFELYKEYKELCKKTDNEPMSFNLYINEILRRGSNNIKGIIKQYKTTEKTKINKV